MSLRFIALPLASLMSLALVACGDDAPNQNDAQADVSREETDSSEDQDTRISSDSEDGVGASDTSDPSAPDTRPAPDTAASDTSSGTDTNEPTDTSSQPDTSETDTTAGSDTADVNSPDVSTSPAPVAGLVIENVTTPGGNSSSKLRARWNALTDADSHPEYLKVQVSAWEGDIQLDVADVATITTEALLEGLPSATTLTIKVERCTYQNECVSTIFATGTTANEVWRFKGTGHRLANLAPIVSDGNVRLAVTLFGADAEAPGPRIHLYYGASPGPGGEPFQGLSIASTSTAPSADDPSSFLTFQPLGADFGVIANGSTSTPLVGAQGIHAGHAVPMYVDNNPVVRLYFESLGNDGKNRILSIDSKDGFIGRDFRTGAGSKCVSSADYAANGPCALRVEIPAEGDVGGFAKIRNARQMKIGYPTHFGWTWYPTPGDFMIFTTDNIQQCSGAPMNQVWATWTGTKWDVEYDSAGCPQHFQSMQAPSPFHIEGGRYKMMYGDPSKREGVVTGSRLPFLGPKQYIYADGRRTPGESTDFEDWDALTNARPIDFKWPDGTLLDATAEGYIDDFHMIQPTDDPDLQVLYVAITDGTAIPTTAVAVLDNP